MTVKVGVYPFALVAWKFSNKTFNGDQKKEFGETRRSVAMPVPPLFFELLSSLNWNLTQSIEIIKYHLGQLAIILFRVSKKIKCVKINPFVKRFYAVFVSKKFKQTV